MEAPQQAGYTTASDFSQRRDRRFLADFREESIHVDSRRVIITSEMGPEWKHLRGRPKPDGPA